MSHHLYFGPTYVGRVDDVIEHQGTFFGQFQLEVDRQMDEETERLFAFIDFCHEWFDAQKTSSPPDASDFDRFADLIGHESWKILDESKQQSMIADAPMFNGGRCGELSWVLAPR
jgi:hypothetical protein